MPVSVVEESGLRVQYYILVLLANFRSGGIGKEDLASILKEAREVLSDEQYRALNMDIKEIL